MPPGDGLRVDPDDLTAHAAHLSRCADSIDAARQAGRHVRLGADAYGQLCAIMPVLLDGLQRTLTDGIGTAATSVGTPPGSCGPAPSATAPPTRTPRTCSTGYDSVGDHEPAGRRRLGHRAERLGGRVDLRGHRTHRPGRTHRQLDRRQPRRRQRRPRRARPGVRPGRGAPPVRHRLAHRTRQAAQRGLDWLAGDPAEITAHAQTWRNVAASLREDAAELAHAVRTEVAGWTGAAATGYRRWAAEQQQAVTGRRRAPRRWPRSPRAPPGWSRPCGYWSATPSPPACPA
ncbi:hypothetical protein V2I01_38560 [Micromonospora sp. BRA006-A]|nr:hypothetical protein [Micromonospora sp. BRA006-A]